LPGIRRLSDGPARTAFEPQKFLGTLNDAKSTDGLGITGCFANHCDWRLPQLDELMGILDRDSPDCNPSRGCLDPIFGAAQFSTWSATTSDGHPRHAWVVSFDGNVLSFDKTRDVGVRAVRSGL
jgi:Protein of unknown function (DUF1566)